MRRVRPFLLLAIALLTAVAASTYVYRWLQAQQLEAKKSGEGSVEVSQKQVETTTIAVAAADIPWGEKITPELIALVDFPSAYVPEGFHQSVDSLEGRVLRHEVRKNEPILESRLVPVDQVNGGVTAVMDPYMRAMAVRVDDEIGVAGFLKPGDRVDLFVTLGGADDVEPIAKLVLESRRVLAVGTEMIRSGSDSEPQPVKVVTLEVSPEEGEKLALGASEGEFRLALRHPLDNETTLTAGATVSTLLASNRQSVKSAAVDMPLGQYEVEVIRGGERSTVSF
jgi:pilus assembly protein CpaB